MGDLYRSLLLGDEEEPNSPTDTVMENMRRRSMLQQEDGGGLVSDGLDVQLSVLADAFEEMQASAARAYLSVQEVLAGMDPMVIGAGADFQKLTGSVMALLEDVSGYFGVAEEGGAAVLMAAKSALEQKQALARHLTDLVANSHSSFAPMKAMTAKILLQMEFLIFMTSAQAGDGLDAPPCPTEATGDSDFEFAITSSNGPDGGEDFDLQRNRRSLLVSGGKGSSSKKSSAVSQAEEMGEGGYAAAVKATANALRENPWNLIKQASSDKAISMLPPRSTAPSDAMAGIKDGVLLHLQRKVRPLLCPASPKRDGHHSSAIGHASLGLL